MSEIEQEAQGFIDRLSGPYPHAAARELMNEAPRIVCALLARLREVQEQITYERVDHGDSIVWRRKAETERDQLRQQLAEKEQR